MGKKLIHGLFFCIILVLAFTSLGKLKIVKAEDSNIVFNLVSDVNVVEAGEDISIYLTLDNVTEVKGETAVINYDTAKLKYAGCQCESSEKLMFARDRNGVLSVSMISELEANLNHISKKLIRLDFKALKGGQASIKITGGRISNRNKKVTTVESSKCGQFTFTIHDGKAEALERIVAGVGSLSDYILVELNNVDAENLQFVNEDLKACRCTTYDEVRTRINSSLDSYLNKVICMQKIVNGKGVLNDYITLGLNSITAEIIPYVNEDLKEYNNSSIAAVRNRISLYLAKYKSMAVINTGNASLTDYSNIGAHRATDYSYLYINSKIKNSGIVSISKMCSKVTEIVDCLKTYTIKGIVKDSKSNNGVSGVLIKFKCSNGQYLTKNGNAVTTTTDGSGNYNIALPEGTYTAEVSRYNYVSKSVKVIADNLNKTFDISMVFIPKMQYKVVLTWGSAPNDLDSHLLGTSASGTSYHVYCGRKKFKEGNEIIAKLDHDDTNAYGPETTTFTAYYNGSYEFYIHNCSEGTYSLANSSAEVKLYQGDSLIGDYKVPEGHSGTDWHVFKIVNGQLQILNTIN